MLSGRKTIKFKNSRQVGYRGETLSIEWLKENGYKFIQRNYRCKAGEIDIIARDKDELCFIEVKTRSNLSFGMPQEAVNSRKLKKMMKTAQFYMKCKNMKEAKFRFDVVAVYNGITLFKNIF